MATNEIQGSSVLAEFSFDGATFKTMVCLTDQSLDGSISDNTTETQCGPIVSIGEPSYTLSGSATVNAAQTSTEVSYEDVLAWFNNKTKVFAKLQSPLNPGGITLALGGAFYHYIQGYFTGVSLSAAVGDIVKFTWTFKGVGVMDITP
jgi:hypothetical protein